MFLYPRDTKDPSKPGRLRLLYECNPIGMIIEQAGGRASTGELPVLDVLPDRCISASASSSAPAKRSSASSATTRRADANDSDTPLFNQRGLFRE